jgi:hypothetical protein
MGLTHSVAARKAAGSALKVGGVVVFFGGLTLVFFLPFLFHPQQLLWPASGLGSDVSYINWPLQTYYIDRLRTEGAFPLWDSRFMLGLPLAGDPHILWLYPLNFLLLWLPTVPALNLFLMFHVCLAGLGMFALLRRGFRTSNAAALLGGLAFMFMPKFMAQTMGGVLAFGLAWVPLVWLGVRLAAKERNHFAGALGGAALALLTPIHIQITYYAAATSVAYFVWLQVSDVVAQVQRGQHPELRKVWRALTAFGVFLASYALLAAPIWIPLLEICATPAANTSRWQMPVCTNCRPRCWPLFWRPVNFNSRNG